MTRRSDEWSQQVYKMLASKAWEASETVQSTLPSLDAIIPLPGTHTFIVFFPPPYLSSPPFVLGLRVCIYVCVYLWYFFSSLT